MNPNHNVYQDPHSGGWIAEFRYVNEYKWHRIGVFGTRHAAMQAVDSNRPEWRKRRAEARNAN